MTGIKLTERLIEDLISTIEIRKTIPDYFTQVKLKGLGYHSPIKDFAIALRFDEFDTILNIVVQLLNIEDRVMMDYEKGVTDITQFLHDVKINKDTISGKLQNIIDTNPSVKMPDNQSISGLLFYRLELLHTNAC